MASADTTTSSIPATEQVVRTVDLLDADATDAAIARSRIAFATWRQVSPGDRARLLRRFAEAIDGDLENLARLEVLNSGHTIGNARWEAGNVRDVVAYYSGAPERLIGQQIPVADGIDVTFHEPLGVVGAIVPWNFPMPIASWAFAPALAAGNTVVLKPAELTPMTAMRLAELALEAGIPEDVFQVLPGKGSVVGQRFVDHADVAKIVFTGSTDVGKRVMAGCAQHVKPVTLELGWQERERGVRRRRSGTRRGHRALCGVRQRRPGLLRPFAHPRPARRIRAVHGAFRNGREGASWSPIPPTRVPRWGR